MSTSRLIALADLPGAEQLLDPERFAALHGAEVTLSRGRLKPAASVLVAHRRTDRSGSGNPAAPTVADAGWTLLISSRDKRDGVVRRAARSGLEVREHPGPAGGPFLLSGGIEADPRLGRATHRVLRSLEGAQPRVLSYNPARHAVLELPQTQQVLRIAARPLDDLLRVTACWIALGVPTTAQRPWRRKTSVLVSERWGEGDLAQHARHEQAVPAAIATGAAIARLHDVAVPAHELPAARLGDRLPATLPEITTLLPERAEMVRRLEQRLRESLPEQPRQGLIHGDLSPDQVLVELTGAASVDAQRTTGSTGSTGSTGTRAAVQRASEGTEPLPQIRLIDLDRSGHGPLDADLGSWIAACLASGTEHLASALLEGYARTRALPAAEELAAWTARALLAGALDPARRFQADWLEALERRLQLADSLLADPSAALAAVAPSACRAAPVGGLVPERVLAGGIVWETARAWPDDGRGLPLELRAEQTLRGARLEPATGEVTVFAPGTDPRLPGLARCLAQNPQAVVVSHRPGKRAVVRIGAAAEQAERYVKIVRPGRAQRLRDALTSSASFDGPFRLQRELTAGDAGGDTAQEDSVTTAALAGATLHEGLPVEDGSWRTAWSATLAAWSQALATSPQAPSGVSIHGPAQEIAVLEAWVERARAVDPGGAALRERALVVARRELTRLARSQREEPQRSALIHRDLHDKQILHAPGLAPGLLDVDTATLGDPAVDLANLRAHAGWRELQGIWSPEHARIAREEIDAAALREGIPAAALAAYESATLARLTCVYAFRPRWRALARSLAADLLPTPVERTVTS